MKKTNNPQLKIIKIYLYKQKFPIINKVVLTNLDMRLKDPYIDRPYNFTNIKESELYIQKYS